MKIKYITTLILTGLLMVATACGNTKEAATNESVEDNSADRPSTGIPRFDLDYSAKMEKEGWELEIRYIGGIYFKDSKNNIQILTHQMQKQVAQGANVVSMFSENEFYTIQVTIDVVECKENMKVVNVMVRDKKNKKEMDYEGCGSYRGQQQIHDIWVLETLNGKKITAHQFPKEFPHFEFNLEDKTMSGFAGCNHVNGNITFDYNRMKIEPLISTRMYCSESSEYENQILTILRNEPVYHLKELRLSLETTEGSMVLKKVD